MPLEVLRDFVQTVRWSEPFILGIIIVHVFIWLFAAFTRKRDLIQFATISVLSIASFNAKHINDYGRKHWHKFATQNYFDRMALSCSFSCSFRLSYSPTSSWYVIPPISRTLSLLMHVSSCGKQLLFADAYV